MMRGGIGEELGLPPCETLSVFSITNQQIQSFTREVHSPMDCFINALQLLGVINSVTANIMRISTAGKSGFQLEEIEKIFVLLTGFNHSFRAIPNPADFSRIIAENLPPGHAVFAGHEGQSKHVYLIGRTDDKRLIYIDPQLGTLCDLASDDCFKLISGNTLFRILFHSTTKLTSEQLRRIGFVI